MGLAENIKKIREFRGFEPMEVVKGTGIKKQNYYAWEADSYKPGQEFLDDLSRFFKVPVSTFYIEPLTDEYLKTHFSSENPTPVPNSDQAAVSEEKRLIATLERAVAILDRDNEKLWAQNEKLWAMLEKLGASPLAGSNEG